MNLNTPWRIVEGDTVYGGRATPRIVDRYSNPVVAFGNQARHRGNHWAWRVARAIVKAVNAAAAAKPAERPAEPQDSLFEEER